MNYAEAVQSANTDAFAIERAIAEYGEDLLHLPGCGHVACARRHFFEGGLLVRRFTCGTTQGWSLRAVQHALTRVARL